MTPERPNSVREPIDPAKTVGGQAVIEGVMMRAPGAWSVAVRQPDSTITARRDPLARLSERNRAARIPLLRGMLILWESLSLGFRALSWSAEKASGEEEEPLSGAQIGWTMAVAVLVFAALFIVLPALAAGVVSGESGFIFNVVEGLLRLSLFVGYIWVIGRSEEIGRVFEYHGAEHMSIHAYEAGEPLSVESVRRYPPEHPRCGTSFLLIVVLGSIIFFSVFGRPGWAFLIGSRLLGIPLIAGLAYELLRWSGTRGGWLAEALAKPGIWLQKLTTRVPDESQIEVAISSLVVALGEEALDEVTARGGIPEVALEVRRSLTDLTPRGGLMDPNVEARLDEIEAAFVETEAQLSDPDVHADLPRLADLGRKLSELRDVVSDIRRWRQVSTDLGEAKGMSDDPEMAGLAEELSEEIEVLEERIRVALVPTDPNDQKDVIVEIRSAAGGDEAAIWAGDLLRMYERYAERHGFRVEAMDSSPSDAGGYDKVTVAVKGRGAYSRMKYEAGVHRVQRVPKTESQGRVHTSTATVAVLPEVEEVDVEIDPADVKIDVYRSTGPGGQSVNTTDSAVRLTHLPTGEVVTCQDEKSQLQNKEKAMRVLRARLYQKELERQLSEVAGARRSQVGGGQRSEKIRTYNYKDNRVTDHRIGLTLRHLDQVLEGDLDELVDAMGADEQATLLREG